MIRRGIGRSGRPGLLGDAPPRLAPGPVTEPVADSRDAVLSALQQLGDLKERRLLTDAEFEAQKARLLGH
ncbi:MAG: hypothetical protein JWN96_3991 [Mycobacterium sp.]|jgi:hypothetical protein|nr:hypothetical protein [Mycobacterium sp.]